MKPYTRQFDAAESMVPLLRAIGREMKGRIRAIAALEVILDSTAVRARTDRAGAASLAAQLSVHRRELRRVEKELARLGWARDEDHPWRLLMRQGERGAQIAWIPEETGFYRRPVDSLV
jgi:hypothetical protein